MIYIDLTQICLCLAPLVNASVSHAIECSTLTVLLYELIVEKTCDNWHLLLVIVGRQITGLRKGGMEGIKKRLSTSSKRLMVRPSTHI
jgi:hypothetical protein